MVEIPVSNGFSLLLTNVGIIRPKIIAIPKIDMFLDELKDITYKNDIHVMYLNH